MPDSAFTSKSLMDIHVPLETGSQQYYITPSGQKTLLKESLITNNSAFNNNFSIYCVPSGESPSGTNVIFSKMSVEAFETVILSNNLVLDNRDSIHASVENVVSGGYINLRLSGIEIES